MWICGWGGSSLLPPLLLWNSATANVFRHLIRVLWRCGLSPVYHNVVCPQGMSALGGSPLWLLWLTHRTSAHQKSLVWCLENPFRCVVSSVTPTSPYTPYIFLNLTVVIPLLEMTNQKGPNTYLMLFHLRCEYGHTHIHHLCSDFL